MRALLALPLLLAACAPMTPAPGPGGGGDQASARDCAVAAAVAREHYRFGADNVPPPLWTPVERVDGSDFHWSCDWSAHGVAFAETFDPDAPAEPGRTRWVKFEVPRYEGDRAIIETGILHGPLAGMGNECELRSGVAGWTVVECRGTWIS